MFVFRYAALTHPGKVPENNEDNFYINGAYKKDAKQNSFRAEGCARGGRLTASVCDGMGGYASGEEASLSAVRTLDQFCGKKGQKEPLFRGQTMDYVTEANERICELRRKKGRPVGSTLAVLEFADDRFTAVNLGDSRIYMLREKKLEQLSTDHTVLGRMLRTGQITLEEARTHPLRHQITQHFGIRQEEMVLEPARTGGEIRDDDRYLICSDGLTDMVSDEKIRECLGTDAPVGRIADDLVQEALNAGGRDNITVIVIKAGRNRGLGSKLRGMFGRGKDEEK